MLNTVLHGDCLELMKDIPDGSVDMILCDLPYGTTHLDWDSVIPFEPLWEQYERIIKDNGAIVLTASQPFTSALVMSNPKMFKHEWIWEKSHGGFATAKKIPLKRHESVLVFSKKAHKYNPQMVDVEGKVRDQRREKRFQQTIEKMQESATHKGLKMAYADDYDPKKRYPKSIISFSNRAEKRIHPTQKPVALFEYLIKTYTNEGDTVLDNCAGSFTTSVACDNTKRQWICIEQEKEYCEIGFDRINENRKKINLPLLKNISKTIVVK